MLLLGKGELFLANDYSENRRALTYFQPRVVLQHSQKMSATACSPVRRTRSSAVPQPTLTLAERECEMLLKRNKANERTHTYTELKR